MTARRHLAVRAAREDVLRALGPEAGQHVVGPTADRWCAVTPAAPERAAALSEALGVPVLLVAVADELAVALYVWGEQIVEYSSDLAGGPAGSLRWAGAAERLIDATDASALPDDVAQVLCGGYPDAPARYADLVPALGLPEYLAGDEWVG